MAYISQEEKKSLSIGIKKVLKKYGMKGSISIRHNSQLVVKLPQGILDIIGDYNVDQMWGRDVDTSKINHLDVNQYHIDSQYKGESKSFLNELHAAMSGSEDGSVENYNNSDVQSDYFDVGYYTDIKVGTWDKPYKHITEGITQ